MHTMAPNSLSIYLHLSVIDIVNMLYAIVKTKEGDLDALGALLSSQGTNLTAHCMLSSLHSAGNLTGSQ